ncbi:MarR family winged helix-turn-helix transcriptional regulator [Actinomycetospora termitidis]|uniref:MarR family winged helix-turn-helix transcriptional regulator n=1 Tax=Actinomycetospora termitidis TaxID=3053470 RepID=A0ABT7M728_9PSEU|nr:MarR family winged helix-turn-helix transcriptional regulator [Actinomycetospora sp. Odt1-22]MDL5155847.1 MarR family winged helix-turn-helix transcriptional regulator [Actinomycetospora sp. Odt1-22]
MDPSGERAAIVRALQRLTASARHLSDAFAARQGLHPTDLEALLHVMQAESQGAPLTAGGLGEALALTSGSVTGVVDRLVAAGHVARSRDASDRRRVLLVHAPEARAVAEDFFSPIARLSGAVMDTFDDAELATVRRYLEAMTDAVTEARQG